MTLTQAQQRYIDRVNGCHTGHVSRVSNAAAKELKAWAREHGYDADVIHRDAKDMAELERNADE